MNKSIRVPLAAAAVIALVAVAAGCGGSEDPASSAAAGNATDRAFIAAMIPHHESAVAMAQVAQDEATGAFVKDLAASIIRTQRAEIAKMRQIDRELADAGVSAGDLGMSGHAMGMDTGADALEGAMPFDRAFMRAMVPHHEGAIAMARRELAKGQDDTLRQIAQAIVAAQEREVAQMNEQLGEDAGSTMEEMHSGHG